MAVPSLRLTGGPSSYQVFAATGALWARVRGRADELFSELVSESPQPQQLAAFRFVSVEQRFQGVDHAGSPLARLAPKLDRFAGLAGWRLEVPGQGIDAVSRTAAGWLASRGARLPMDVWFYARNFPLLHIEERPGATHQWDVESPRLPDGSVLDWRVAVLVTVAMTDLRLRTA